MIAIGDKVFGRLEDILKKIKKEHRELSEKAERIRNSGIEGLNESPTVKLRPLEFEGDVCAVDSGFLFRRFSGYDVAVCRAAGVLLYYESGEMKKTEYCPSRRPGYDVDVVSGLDEHESASFRSIFRLEKEISLSLKMIEEFSPAVFLVDGSLLPLPSDNPGKQGQLKERYSALLKTYERLFEKSIEKETVLAGVIKDSRSKRFSGIAGVQSPDVLFTDSLLKEDERTAVFSYSDSGTKINNSEKIKCFYLKPSKHDLPLRVEYFDSGKDGKIAEKLLYLSKINRSFAYPSVLIEADMCAALDGSVMDDLQGRISGGMRPLKRNSRPFSRR